MPTTLSLHCWNINGIRAVVAKEPFQEYIKEYSPDILCLQEIKAQDHQIPKEKFNYPYKFWNPAQRPGYSGTAILTKKEPINVIYGMDAPFEENEGRVITAEFENFFLVNVYTPNSGDVLQRLSYREKDWDPAFKQYIKKLSKKKPVITCGDFNAAHKEIDIARPKENVNTAGFTPQERKGFDNLLTKGNIIDTFRHFHPEEENRYSWWSYRGGARRRNVGWRIDYVLVSPELIDQVEKSFILDKVMGSDHAPVGIELKLS